MLAGYEVVRLLGRGGMGEVYEAVRVGPGGFKKSIAIKRLPSEKTIDGASVQRFLQEARISAQLDHPNIVRIHDLVAEDGYFLVMELLRGWNLNEAMRPRFLERGPPSSRAALEIAEQVLAGLAYAHALTDEAGRSLGLVHRDLTPRNLFLTESGSVKILDFGLAKLVDALTPGLTESGHLHGTLGFLAPEQARGEASSAQSDLYQLGGVVYWMLSNRVPNGTGSAGEVLARAVHQRPTPLGEVRPDLPAAVVALVEQAMAHAPADRFAGAVEMRARVQAVLREASALPDLAQLVAELPPPAVAPALSHRTEQRTADVSGVSDTVVKGAPVKAAVPQPPQRGGVLIAGVVLAAATLGYLAADLARAPAPAPVVASAPLYRRMTFRPGWIAGARFTPDATSIVYSARFSGAAMETFLKTVADPEVRPLGLRGSELVGLARDGKLALLNDASFDYGFVRKGTLAESSLSGAAPRERLIDVQDAEFMPDGELAILRWRGPTTTLELPPGRVLHDAGTSVWLGEIRVSPDGRFLALSEHPVRYDDRGRVVIYDLAANQLRPLTGEFLSIGALAWGPDGREIWFSASSQGSSRQIHAVDLHGSVRSIEEGPGSLEVLDVLPDGRALVSHFMQSARIYAQRSGEEVERDLTWFDFDAVFDLAADGSSVIFVEGSNDAGGPGYGAYLRGLDGTPAIQLAPGLPWAIAPDGSEVLVTPKARDRLQLVPSRAGEARPVTGTTGIVGAGAWFGDGARALVATSSTGGDRFWLIDVKTATARALPHRGLHLPLGGNPISPDGARFAALDAGNSRLMLASLDGGEPPRPIPGALVGEHVLRWAPDGASVLVGHFGDAPLVIARLDLTTGERSRWRTLMPADSTAVLGIVSAGISRDLKAYAYTATRTHSTLYLVENLR